MRNCLILLFTTLTLHSKQMPNSETTFGKKFPELDNRATADWWTRQQPTKKKYLNLDVSRENVIGFALYTLHNKTLKLTAQLFPLKPDETQTVRLEIKKDDTWTEVAKEKITYPGWSAHFRVSNWNHTSDTPYRVRHGEKATFEGLIRKEPTNNEILTIASLSCNSSLTPGPRKNFINNLLHLNPDLLFFAGDQTYHHTQHTTGWLEFGLQFREVLKNRPTITIPDDHDIGQANLWGDSGSIASSSAGPDGGYFYPAAYVNMVQRQQTWHLPDPHDATPVKQNISVYYTNLTYGGVSFAILEDRKFKSGPKGNIPKMGPRPDHINVPGYDPKSVDLPGLTLLGDRQLKFLNQWSQDWTNADLKVVLSQPPFCSAVHLHGSRKNRLLADLDSNAWPQTPRNKALIEIRRARATHLCGDQHLANVVKHGISSHNDGPYSFTSPAIVNTIYGRWWEPLDKKAGPNPRPKSPLPWTGNYHDGLGNKITMLAYANPKNTRDEKQRGDGYGFIQLNKKTGKITFNCYPRFNNVKENPKNQYSGWPITISTDRNDGRKATGHLNFESPIENPVIQVINEKSNEILYTFRSRNKSGQLPVYTDDTFTIKFGKNTPDKTLSTNLSPK